MIQASQALSEYGAANVVAVGLAEIQAAAGPVEFACYGIGCGLGVFAFDSSRLVWGIGHFMLPEASGGSAGSRPARFVSEGLNDLLAKLAALGADREALAMAYCGGAKPLGLSSSAANLDIGSRNAATLERLVESLNLRCVARDVGGVSPRTLRFSSRTGELRVSCSLLGEKQLCTVQ